MADIETVAVSTDGKPIVTMKVIDKETGTETPVNVSTCAEAVVCSQGTPMEQHLSNLYGHANDSEQHLAPGEKAGLETKEGAQAKATAAKNEAITASSLEIAAAKREASEDATTKAAGARDAAYRYADQVRTDLTHHTKAGGNPHNVTAAQVGLGNVPNKSTNDQQPTFTEADVLSKLSSGERLAIAFGKIAKAINEVISHLANDGNPHKVTAKQAGALPTSGGTMNGPLTVQFNEGITSPDKDGENTVYLIYLNKAGQINVGWSNTAPIKLDGSVILSKGVNYGTSLPADGVEGQLFFLQD